MNEHKFTFTSNDPKVHYEEVCELGEGDESNVYLARKVQEGSDDELLVAVKKSKKEENWGKATGRNLLERFQFQAEHAEQLRHPNIVEVFEFVDQQETVEQQRRARPHLVMEYVEGVTLRQRLKPRRVNGHLVGTELPLEDILNISEQTLRGLSHTHGQRPAIVHRDIRPEQIMITPAGNVKILDFGLAKELWSLDADYVKTMITTGGGTWDYMAPEQLGFISRIQGEDVVPVNYVPQTDVYTFGVTLYEMARGVVLPRKEERGSMEHYVPSDADLTFLDRRIDLRPVIVKATQYDIEKRYPTAKEFLEAMSEIRERHDALKAGRGTSVAVPARLDDAVEAEYEKVPQPALPPTTALTKPTGALVPKMMDMEALNAAVPPQKPWYIRHAPLLGIPVGAAGIDIAANIMGIVVATDTGMSLVEVLKHMYTNPVPLMLKAAMMIAPAIAGPIVGYFIKKNYNPSPPPTRALAAPDEGNTKRSLVQRIEERVIKDSYEEGHTVLGGVAGILGLGISAGSLTGNWIYGIAGAIAGVVVGGFYGEARKNKIKKRKEFRENLGDFIAQQFGEDTFTPDGRYNNISAVLDAVEKEYSPKARRTFAHNYATKMLEEWKYDEVVKVGVQVLTYVRDKKREGFFAGRKARRQESELLENICLGLISKRALKEFDQLLRVWTAEGEPRETAYDTTCENVLGRKKLTTLFKFARDRLREVHHNLYGRKEDDEDVKQYAALCRTFGMEPNLEKLTRALVPAPVEEARALMRYDLQTYMSDSKIPTTVNPLELAVRNIDDVERIQREQGTIIRQCGARAYAHQALKKGEYDKVGEVIKYALQQPEQNKEIPHIEELLYGLLNKGAWGELARIPGLGKTIGRIHPLGNTPAVKFDASVKQRLEEVMPYLKDASIDEEKAYRQACEVFEYKEGQEAVVKVEAEKVRAAIAKQVRES